MTRIRKFLAYLSTFAVLTAAASCSKPKQPPIDEPLNDVPLFQSTDSIPMNSKRYDVPFIKDMQRSVTAYFNAHKLSLDSIPPDLTIPWVDDDRESTAHGFLVTHGKISPAGCPSFTAIVFGHEDRSFGRFIYQVTTREQYKVDLCP